MSRTSSKRSSSWPSPTTEYWRWALLLAGGVALSVMLRDWFWAIGATLLVIGLWLWASIPAFFLTRHSQYHPPLRRQIATLNAVVGLLLISATLWGIDAIGSAMMENVRFRDDRIPNDAERTLLRILAPDSDDDDRFPSHWGQVSTPSHPAQPADPQLLIARGCILLVFLKGMVRLLNLFFCDATAIPRWCRIALLGLAVAVVSFLVVWRWVPWEVICGPSRSFAELWLLVTFIGGAILALPMTESP